MRRMILRTVSATLVAFALATGPVVGQVAAPAAGETVGQHVVRPGDTLEGITAHYLGTSERWRENWRLNPDLKDPNRISPGQTLRVLVRDLPEETARLARRSRRVEDKLDPRDWANALANDLLLPLDEVQTYEGASAELEFPDTTKLLLTEQTLVILGEGEKPAAPAPDRKTIEIEYGQADLAGTSSRGSMEVEIQLGKAALAKPRAAAGEAIRTRNRVRQGVGQLMVYEGASDLDAGGASVEVAEGMGSSVTPGEPPSPPEKLLDAPRALEPEPGSVWDADPDFTWEAVAGARSYTVEVCRDPECAELVARSTDVGETTWKFREPLRDGAGEAMGQFFWRVTAASASGLDGYPGSSQSYSRIAALAAFVPPRVVFRFQGGPKVGVSDRLVVGPGTFVEAEVEPTPNLKRWVPLFDGAETTLEGWRAPFTSGTHTVGVLAIDNHNRRAVAATRTFIYDPDPPEIRWGEEDGAELGHASGVSEEVRAASTRPRQPGYWARVTGTDASPLVWTSSKVKWLTMQYGEWEIGSDKPYIVVRARKKKPVSFPTLGVEVTQERGLTIQALDPVCGVEKMSYQILLDEDNREILVIDAVDALGNRSRLAWPFVRTRHASP